jgi:hypothetical protein
MAQMLAAPAPDNPNVAVTPEQLRWRPLADLPSGDPKKVSKTQEDSYVQLLEGKAVRYSIRSANYFFVRRGKDLDDLMKP